MQLVREIEACLRRHDFAGVMALSNQGNLNTPDKVENLGAQWRAQEDKLGRLDSLIMIGFYPAYFTSDTSKKVLHISGMWVFDSDKVQCSFDLNPEEAAGAGFYNINAKY